MDPNTSIIIIITLVVIIIVCFVLLWILNKKEDDPDYPAFSLTKAECNPIVSPDQHWEEVGTFNPGVFKDQNGFHIFYRAVGGDGVSRVGYAHSSDGKFVDKRLSYPIFSMQYLNGNIPQEYSLKMYPSGGSWGGCEDPRVVKIENRIYLTFSAFQGWQSIRIAVSSMSESDFNKGNWKWSTPMLISPENEQNKNWVLFPEKINGKFAILHSVTPTVLIDYVDSFEELAYGNTTIQSRSHQQNGGRPDYWDNRIRGAGPPPIRTNRGWLLFYHAISHHESHKYKLGAMLLDFDDPQKVIARSPTPILVPTEWYENDSKPGVVYACGATVHDDTLSIYYGGGDKYLCVAHASLSELLDWLTRYGTTKETNHKI